MTKEEMEEQVKLSQQRQRMYLDQMATNPLRPLPGWLLVFIAVIFFISGAATVAIYNYYHG